MTGTADAYENPYFNITKNKQWNKTSRVTSVSVLNFKPTDWLTFRGKFGLDIYSDQNYLLRHPESNLARSYGGIIDDAVANNRSLTYEYFAMANKQFGDFKVDFKIGSTVYDYYYKSVAGSGESFLDPNFAALNNIPPDKQRNRSRIEQKRIIGAVSILTLNYKSIMNVQLTGRSDRSSTLPTDNNSFFYPGANFALVLSEIPALKEVKWLTFAKLRGAYAIARKDPPPYGVYPALESQTTTGGGYAYGFTGPNPLLRPEKTTSYEGGVEFKVFNNRLGMDATYYKKESVDQIISNLRLSYGTGYVLSVMNGGTMWNSGVELQFTGVPVIGNNFRWEINANFNQMSSKLTYLPAGLLEFYNSDTWFYGNVRNGAIVGESTSTLSGLPYARNINGDILVNPQTGTPIRKGTFGSIGDRNPDFAIGISNRVVYKNFELSFLLDTRKGGDVFNGTEHFLVSRGLATSTLDRETPVVIKGVMKDGLENSADPTWNNIQILPYTRGTSYYTTPNTGLMNEEDFVEKNINWVRLKDVTLSYRFSKSFLDKHIRSIKNLSVFATGTDLFILTNYRGLDPVILGNNAAVLGSGSSDASFDGPMRNNFAVSRASKFVVSLLDGTVFGVNDPRIGIMLPPSLNIINAVAGAKYVGVEPNMGATPIAANDRPYNFYGINSVSASPTGTIGMYLFTNNVRWPLMTYSQLQFMKSEAAYRKGDKTTALAAYSLGVSSAVDFTNTYIGATTFGTVAAIPPAAKTTFLAGAVPATIDGLTMSKIMCQKYLHMWTWAPIETWSDMRRYHYTDTYPGETTQVYAGLVIPALASENTGKLIYRVRPRYNSEYVWNAAALDKVGGLATDYHTKETWFSIKE